MSKRSSSCRRTDFFSLIKITKRQSSDCRGSKFLRHESPNNKSAFHNFDDITISGTIYKLVEKDRFDDCVVFVKDLSNEQVDVIARNLPIALILSKIPKSLKLIEVLYSKNTKYFSDKTHLGLTNSMPPDVLLNRLVAWIYSLDQQKFNMRSFQSHKHMLVKILKHIFASSPVLRNKLTKKLISLERSFDSVTQETCNPLHTIHPLLLKVPLDSKSIGGGTNSCAAGGQGLSGDWKSGVEKLKQDFVAMFRSITSEQTDHQSKEAHSGVTMETIERRLFESRRMLDAIEPLESIIVHVTKQLRRSMETDKEVIFNCIQFSKELNLPESTNSKRPLSLTLSAPLMIDSKSPSDHQHIHPSSSTSSILQPSLVTPRPSSFLVVPFLGRLVRSYSKIVALISDDQLGPRVVFNTNCEDSSLVGGKFKKKLSSHSFNDFGGKNNNDNNIINNNNNNNNNNNIINNNNNNNNNNNYNNGYSSNIINTNYNDNNDDNRSNRNNNNNNNNTTNNNNNNNNNNNKFNNNKHNVNNISKKKVATKCNTLPRTSKHESTSQELGKQSDRKCDEELKVESCRRKIVSGERWKANDDDDDDDDGEKLKLENSSKELKKCKRSTRKTSDVKKIFPSNSRSPTRVEKVYTTDLQLIGLYGNMYHVTRAEVMEALNDVDELEACTHLKMKILLSMIVLSFRLAKTCLHRLQEEIQKLLDSHLNSSGCHDDHTWLLSNSINLYLRRSTMNQHVLKKKAKEVYERVLSTLDNYPSLRKCSKLLSYAESAVELCWLMVISIPSVVLIYDGQHFDSMIHERCRSSSDPNSIIIKTFLWPGIREAPEGKCLSRAVVVT